MLVARALCDGTPVPGDAGGGGGAVRRPAHPSARTRAESASRVCGHRCARQARSTPSRAPRRVRPRRSCSPSVPASRWDEIYAARGAEGVSWHQAEAAISLSLSETSASNRMPLSSTSAAALRHWRLSWSSVASPTYPCSTSSPRRWSRHGVEPGTHRRSSGVTRICPCGGRSVSTTLWHDRALFHFLVGTSDRDHYLETLFAALRPHGSVIIGAFAPDAPDRCSGLPAHRLRRSRPRHALGRGLRARCDPAGGARRSRGRSSALRG